jgi:hypothetical protein
MEQRHHTNFDDFSLVRTLGDAVRREYKLSEVLPEQLKELLAKLDAQGVAEDPAALLTPRQPKKP